MYSLTESPPVSESTSGLTTASDSPCHRQTPFAPSVLGNTVRDGKPVFVYNYLSVERTTVTGSAPLPKGKVTIVMDFAYGGGPKGIGETGDGDVVGQRREGWGGPARPYDPRDPVDR